MEGGLFDPPPISEKPRKGSSWIGLITFQFKSKKKALYKTGNKNIGKKKYKIKIRLSLEVIKTHGINSKQFRLKISKTFLTSGFPTFSIKFSKIFLKSIIFSDSCGSMFLTKFTWKMSYVSTIHLFFTIQHWVDWF